MDLSVTWAGALLAGLISFASPCVLPLVPPYLCFLAGVSLQTLTGEDSGGVHSGRIVASAVAFVLGFAAVFVSLGASASLIGSFAVDHLTELGYVAGAIILILGLHFLGIFKIGILSREARFQTREKPVGLVGAFVVGLAFAFGWTPCVGPVLAAILFVAAGEAEAFKGASLLFAYSLGIGIPFIVAALFAGPFVNAMKRFRRHMGMVEKVMGGALVLTGILFLTGSMQTMSYLLLEYFPGLGKLG
ncbi:cytochrome c biogenesis protein CcdA [Rhizobiales bacterium]|uniref:cytochrome c biogenesis protein CcdA n=1 Tax=Hongsoonwoonella zoysiae TaxID=2821844 RepID=UPI0015610F6E|nr:cytochrome c biogenesis protein CcdA [Hongsoonwoonella zoysiae]